MQQRILALIDNLFFAARVDGVARHLGFAAIFARDAAEFRRLLREAPPDLVIVDMAGPTEVWEPLVRELKAEPATAGVPILAFGKHTQADLFKLARQAGCDKVLTNAQLGEQLPSLLADFRFRILDSGP
ncbi:MAG: hypothetical protein HY690_05745 [Chloroflexi bacterium]|nr:hypothetical protein [Chloroflexota bacterium]